MAVFRLFPLTRRVFSHLGEVADVIAEIDLDDREKEKAIQGLAYKLTVRLVQILFVMGLCILIPLACLWIFDRLRWLRLDSVLAFSFSWQFLTATVVVFVTIGLIRNRASGKKQQIDTFENRYSHLDRTLHRAAFALQSPQKVLAKLEDVLFRKAIKDTPEDPVFITALPRAGTTLLLDLLYETGEFCTHTYRNMPFLLTPIFWHGLSKHFQKSDAPRERAQGDGVLVSVDSPEAFEEALWCSFWREHYRKDRIMPWAGRSLLDEFDCFLRNHMSKIAYLDNAAKPKRYVSKNNLNIARIPYLKKIFPDSLILVPVRSPLQQSYSLWHQHQRFSEIHDRDDFARRYMRDLGHFDFGRNFKPIKFARAYPGEKSGAQAEELVFWLEYWLISYATLYERREQLLFFDYDHFCSNSQADALKLGLAAGVDDLALLQQLANRVGPNEPADMEGLEIDGELLEQCLALYNQICQISLNYGEQSNYDISQ